MDNRIEDRVMLKDMIDRYATESDKNNQDFYREIFRQDVKLKVYFSDKLGMDINNVEDMIAQYKAFVAAKESFHQNGQQVVDFIDETHATGICYAIATLVTEEDGKDKLTFHAVRYYDKYIKVDGRWWIAEREQHFVYTSVGMIRTVYVLMLVISSITSITQPRQYITMDDERIISDLYADMYRAMIDKDTARLSDILDTDFVLVHMTGMSQAKNDYLRYISEGTLNYYSCEDTELNIKVNGDSAYIIGRSYVLAAVFGGRRHRWPLCLGITLRKKMNRWLITKTVASTF